MTVTICKKYLHQEIKPSHKCPCTTSLLLLMSLLVCCMKEVFFVWSLPLLSWRLLKSH